MSRTPKELSGTPKEIFGEGSTAWVLYGCEIQGSS